MGGFERLFAAERMARPLKRFGEARTADRLEQIIHRVRRERLKRITIVRSDENHRRQMCRRDTAEHLEAIKSRHLDVEKEKIRLEGFDAPYRFGPIAALPDDLEVGRLAKPQANAVTRERLIVGDKDSDHCCSTVAAPNGMAVWNG